MLKITSVPSACRQPKLKVKQSRNAKRTALVVDRYMILVPLDASIEKPASPRPATVADHYIIRFSTSPCQAQSLRPVYKTSPDRILSQIVPLLVVGACAHPCQHL